MLLLLGLLACTTDVQVGDTKVDDDGDGYSDEVDCDDARASVHPEADETCDGTDEDCDGEVDEDAVDGAPFHPDADTDGWGDATVTVTACAQPAGHVEDATDCDDGDAAVNPGATEVCDPADLDEDCDGLADDADATVDPAGQVASYADGDGDGYGDVGTVILACEALGVADATDCDDGDATVNPGATEVCDPADLDEDCDGLADDADATVDPAGQVASYADGDGDGYGDAGTVILACEALGVADATDCDDGDATVNPAATEVCDPADVDEDCDGLADDADATVDPASQVASSADGDGDGYGDAGTVILACEAVGVADATDCNDGDAAVNPGATEVCDSADVDEDCDGLADDADASVDPATLVTTYADGDADGHGDPGTPLLACESVGVADATDCNDGDASVNPGATEVCDPADVDEDCDGLADDADPSTTGTTTWHVDTDGDGYGGATPVSACDAPAGALADATDCDDADPTISPAALEVCADGIDQDCDGADRASCGWTGEVDLTAEADVWIEGEAAGAQMGLLVATGLDLDGDGLLEIAASTKEEVDGNTAAGAVWVWEAAFPAGSSYAPDHAVAHLLGDSGTSSFGSGVLEPLRDLDGDGNDELLAADSFGYARLLPGPVTGDVAGSTGTSFRCFAAASTGTADGAGETWACGNPYALTVTLYDGGGASVATVSSTAAYFGQAIAGAADGDGDGVDDLWIAAPFDSTGGSSAGLVYGFRGPLAGSVTTADADAVIIGRSGENLGLALRTLDRDGDGDGDIALSGPQYNGGRGALYVFDGDTTGTHASTAADALVLGSVAGTYLGAYGFAAGDLDGDGADDLLASCPSAPRSGAAPGLIWGLSGPLTGTYDLADPTDYDVLFYASGSGSAFGTDLAVLPDTSGDALPELVVSTYYGDSSEARGGVMVVYGR